MISSLVTLNYVSLTNGAVMTDSNGLITLFLIPTTSLLICERYL